MQLFPIQSFRPIETRVENNDQDRTVLRLAEGVLAVPNSALCNGPRWKSMWGITDLPARAATALAGADAFKAHFIEVQNDYHVLLVCWSLFHNRPVGMAYVAAGQNIDFQFDSPDTVTVTAPNTAAHRDKDYGALWYASVVGDRVLLGNGIDANLQWSNYALSVLGPASAPADVYDNSRVRIPPCTTFAMNGNKSVFAAGNAAQPLRVWITHAPTASYPFNEGIYSIEQSFIDVRYNGATRITALTAFQNYITAHTDGKPVNLFDVDGSNDGWKCIQSPGVANSSAPCPAAAGDTLGWTSFYLGADGEVYKDESIRTGPFGKQVARDQEIVTALCSGQWNRDMLKPVAPGGVFVAYDRKNSLFWMFARVNGSGFSRLWLWCYNERNNSISGPFRYPNTRFAALIPSPTAVGPVCAVVTLAGELLYSDLGDIGETQEFLSEPKSTPLGSAFAQLESAPTPTSGLPYVGMTATGTAISEVLAGLRLTMPTAWDSFVTGDTTTLTRFWKDAYVARIETGYMDLGNPSQYKNFHDVRLTFQKHSRCYVGIYAESDGFKGGKWSGLVFSKEQLRVPLNICGRSVRVRVVMVCFNDAKTLLRSAVIGWTPGGIT